ncbi:hypothetical protein HPB50_023427 [Hyalomma asiaticum]|uniref:Uncharacterized protein n=1 Tax=Hyalomma asiaticum TaxID=266040 RepID=A0ACB7TQK1_HYAAI|nr:hypothetical protein HPB50_023427 [Hyalomma asiaticum]
MTSSTPLRLGNSHAKKKALKTSPHGKVEEAHFAWFMDLQAKSIPVGRDLLQQKARSFVCLFGDDEFKASSGRLSCFKERRGIVGKMLNGEASSTNMAVVGDWLFCACRTTPRALGEKSSEHSDVHRGVAAVSQGPETAEAAPDSASAVHQHEDAWEYLRSVDEVPIEMSFSDYVSTDANVVTTVVTTEVLDAKDISRLVSSMKGEVPEDVDDTEKSEAPIPTPRQVMAALDLLRQFAGT